MTNASVGPTAADLFRKWQVFLDGDPASATSLVDSAPPDVAGPLQRLIDNYIDSHSTDVNPTDADPTDGRPSEPEPLPVIPGYTVLHRLGRGGMGEVFLVRDALDRERALKVARRRQLSAAGRERFRSEARAMARLDHPNVVRVGHYDDHGGRPYFEMDLYPANLADRVGDYADPRAAVRLMAQVAAGVGHLHARGFVHRDLKPSNILLAGDGRPVVGDFGLIKGPTDTDAGAADSGARGSAETDETGARGSHTVAGMVLGTRRYMAPDQAAGLNHQASPAWDVWALGVMLHELLTGQPPRSSSAPERLLNSTAPDNPPATQVKHDLDPRLGRIIDTCLARDPANRYPNGAAVAADLKEWLHRGRRMWTRIVGACLVVLLVAGTITAAMNLQRKGPPDPRELALAEIQQQLRDGKTVELIGATGLPRWFEVAASGGSKPFVSDVNGTMRVNDDEVTLIDLPPTGLERYRFEVQVRQLGNARAGKFGAYAGRHRRASTTSEAADCVAVLWFNELGGVRDHPDGPPRLWESGLQYVKQVPGSGAVIGGLQLEQGANEGNGDPTEDGWHTVAVEVRPNQMAWSFDGKPARPVAFPLAPADEAFFTASAKLVPDAHTDFSPRGGYGLFVQQGAAGFRNARVIPLDR